MKKIRKGLLVLSLGLVLVGTGCSCSDNTTTTETTEKSRENYGDSFQGLYEDNVKSTVAIYAYNNNYTNPSLGSGVVYKEESGYAYILTNAHVLFSKYDSNRTVINREYTDVVEVVHSNYKRVKAVVMGYDRDEDVAVLRINKSDNYKVATIVADDSSTKVLEPVFAIGNPHGNLFSPTEGVITSTRIKTSVSYVSRENTDTTFVYNSSATINAGNSGGPLFNSRGEVVSINTMYPVDTDSTVYRNYNYSIPARHFVNVADYIIDHGDNSYKRVYLNLTGESISSMTVSRRNSLGISVENGIYVTSSSVTNIVENARVIVEVGGVAVNTMNDLEYELLTKYGNATNVEITVVDKIGTNRNTYTVSLSK